jgi:uncharacterized OB-fold protein
MIVPRYTREIPQRYRLEASKCGGCGYLAFPPRPICPECGERRFETVTLRPSGRIISWTTVFTPAEEFSTQAPFAVGVIETDDGARLTAQIVDCGLEEIATGGRVRLMLRCIQREGHGGILQYGYKAVLER